jgi:hypothetical protein
MHERWADHKVRVAVTSALAQGIRHHDATIKSVADLSCGDGVIANSLGLPVVHLGDFAPGYQITGPLEQTLDKIPDVDVYVCSETLEHVDDPAAVLAKIRAKTRYLVLSTPIDAWNETNPEHYWAWGRSGVEELFTNAGFRMLVFNALDMRHAPWSPYCFGIWLLN